MEDSSGPGVGRSDLAFPAEESSEHPADGTARGSNGFLLVDESLAVIGASGISDLLSDEESAAGKSVDSLFPPDCTGLSDAVRKAFREDEPAETEFTVDGNRRLAAVVTPTANLAVVRLRSTTAYPRLLRELERSRKVLDTIDEGIYTLDEAFVITSVNDAVTEITGYSRDELVGAHASKLAGDETLSMATEILEQLRDDGTDMGVIESSIQSASGESIPIETRFSTVEFDNGDKRRVGLLLDATDRRRHERTLRNLNQSARQLLRADGERRVCETIVDVASSLWSDATVVTYLYDQSGPHLDPVATEGVSPEPKGPGTAEWEAFATGRSGIKGSGSRDSDGEGAESSAEDDYSKPTGRVVASNSTDQSGSQTLFASLEEHGLLTVEFGSETDPTEANESVELLAANAVAALGRVEREAELSRRQDELLARNDRLERVYEFNDLLRRINSILVDATTLDDIARAVCDHLVGADRIAFAWFGEIYRNGERLEPVAKAGAADGYLDGLTILGTDPTTLSTGADTPPAGRALAGRDSITISDISTDLRTSEWRERSLVRGFQSTISVPIAYNDLTYGVLSVYADRQGEFDGRLGKLLEELGETIGNAINGLETKRSLRSRTRVELQLRIEDPDTLSSRIAAALDEPVVIEAVVPEAEDRSVLYLQTGSDPTELATSVIAVEDVRPLGDDDKSRVAVTVTDDTLVDRLTDYGGEVKQLRAEPDDVEVTVLLPRTVDVRGLVDALERQYADVELLARRNWTATEEGELSTAVQDRLTDRQYEVAETAYLNGYFEWPRESTGEEVADRLDITQPTFNHHLRRTERTLFSLLFGDAD